MQALPIRLVSSVVLALATVGCASRGQPDAPGGQGVARGQGFVRGRLGTQDVDMTGRLMHTRVHMNPAFSWLMLSPSLNEPEPATPVTLTVVFRGRQPGTFRVINRDTTGVTAQDDVGQVMIHVARRKWAAVDGQLDVTQVEWSGQDLRRLAGSYRGNVRSPDGQVVPGSITFSYE